MRVNKEHNELVLELILNHSLEVNAFVDDHLFSAVYSRPQNCELIVNLDSHYVLINYRDESGYAECRMAIDDETIDLFLIDHGYIAEART
jgi:hypothetical protein